MPKNHKRKFPKLTKVPKISFSREGALSFLPSSLTSVSLIVLFFLLAFVLLSQLAQANNRPSITRITPDAEHTAYPNRCLEEDACSQVTASKSTPHAVYRSVSPDDIVVDHGTASSSYKAADTSDTVKVWKYEFIDVGDDSPCDGDVPFPDASNYTEGADVPYTSSNNGKKLCFQATDIAAGTKHYATSDDIAVPTVTGIRLSGGQGRGSIIDSGYITITFNENITRTGRHSRDNPSLEFGNFVKGESLDPRTSSSFSRSSPNAIRFDLRLKDNDYTTGIDTDDTTDDLYLKIASIVLTPPVTITNPENGQPADLTISDDLNIDVARFGSYQRKVDNRVQTVTVTVTNPDNLDTDTANKVFSAVDDWDDNDGLDDNGVLKRWESRFSVLSDFYVFEYYFIESGRVELQGGPENSVAKGFCANNDWGIRPENRYSYIEGSELVVTDEYDDHHICFRSRKQGLLGNPNDDYSGALSALIENVATDRPTITVNNGSADNTFKATDDYDIATDTTWDSIFFNPDDDNCDHRLAWSDATSYDEDTDVSYTISANNGQQVCFRSQDVATKGYSYKASTTISASDTTAPTITSISSTTTDGLYGLTSSPINITVNFSESVTATNTLKLNLSNGHQSSACTTCSGQALVFSYTVTTGGDSDDLDVTDFVMTDVTIVDASNNEANLAIPTNQNLADHQALVIDATPPDIDVDPGTDNTFIATDDDDGTTTWHYVFIASGANCDKTVSSFSETYTEGVVVPYNDSRNGQQICFRSEDSANNAGYKASATIDTDTTAPTITSITSTTDDGLYGLTSSPINITVTFSESVTATDTLKLNLSNGHQSSVCSTCSGQALVFSYTVADGGDSDDLDVTDFAPADVTIVDAADLSANLAIPDTKNLADAKALVIDATPPKITINFSNLSVSATQTDANLGMFEVQRLTTEACNNTLTTGLNIYTAGTPYTLTVGEKACFKATDLAGNVSYAFSAVALDTVDPDITVRAGTTNTFKATDTDDDTDSPTTWYYEFIASGDPCNETVTFPDESNYEEGDPVPYDDSHNGQKLCFKSVDAADNDGYGASIPIEDLDTTPPDITVVAGTDNSFKATDDDDDTDSPTTWNFTFIDENEECDNSHTFASYAEGGNVTYDDSRNGQRVCFSSTDTAGNTGYKPSAVIEGTDTTPPEINVMIGSVDNSFKATDDDDDTDSPTTWYYEFIASGDPCNETVTFPDESNYEEGDPVTYTDSKNTQRVCFRSTDGSSNHGYGTSTTINTDTTDPDITVEAGTDNSFIATDNETSTSTWHYAFIAGDATCGDSVTFPDENDYTEGAEANYTDANNTQKLCFRSVDDHNNIGYEASDVIDTDTTAPTIEVVAGSATNSFEATDDDDGTTTWHYRYIAIGTDCDKTLTFSDSYTEEQEIIYDDSRNGQKLCFRSEDSDNNAGYEASGPIQGLDTTPPDITVVAGTDNSYKATDTDDDTDSPTDWHRIYIDGNVECDDNLEFTTRYTEGDEIIYDDDKNGDKLCFRSVDDHDNDGYGASDVIDTDTTAPTITSINSTTNDGSYGLNAVINITVNMSESVTVTGDLKLNLSNGHSSSVCSNPCSGQALAFSYTVTTGGDSDDLNVTDFVTTDVTIVDATEHSADLAIPDDQNLADTKAIKIDATPPDINITFNNFSVSATVTEANPSTFQSHIVTTEACDNSLTTDFIDYTAATSLTLIDGQKACFKATDTASNTAYELSDVAITPPEISITQDAATNRFQAVDDQDDTTWRYAILYGNDTCSINRAFNEYTEGDDVEYSSAINNRRICFEVTDTTTNRVYYKPSDRISIPVVTKVSISGQSPIQLDDTRTLVVTFSESVELTGDLELFKMTFNNLEQAGTDFSITAEGRGPSNTVSFQFTAPLNSYTTGIDTAETTDDQYLQVAALSLGAGASLTDSDDGHSAVLTVPGNINIDAEPNYYSKVDARIPTVTVTNPDNLDTVTSNKVFSAADNWDGNEDQTDNGSVDIFIEALNILVPHYIFEYYFVSATDVAAQDNAEAADSACGSNYFAVAAEDRFSYIEGTDVVVTEEHNDHHICFRSRRQDFTYRGGPGYDGALSALINNIDSTPPEIDVDPGDVTNSFKATDDDDGTTTWHYVFIASGANCDNTVSAFSETYTEGEDVVYTDADNDQQICFRSQDSVGNAGYKASPPIEDLDTTAPTITSITSTTDDGSYGLGSSINITVNLSESVTATNTLKLNLSNGHQSSACTTCSGQALVFSYTVADGGDSDDLDVTDFVTTDVTIIDDDDNSADLAIPATKNLADAKDLVIDATPPEIRVDVGGATNSFKATDDDDGTTTWHYVFIAQEILACASGVTFPDVNSYTEEQDVGYTDARNTQRLCFRSVDAANNTSYKASDVIDTDTTAPTITVRTGDATYSFKATDDDDGTTTWHRVYIAANATCNSSHTFQKTYTEGSNVNYTDGRNGQKLCFRSVDSDNNAGYEASDPIEGIDTTPPTITVTAGSSPNSFRATDLDDHGTTTWHRGWIAPDIKCNDRLSITTEYDEGQSIPYTEVSNGWRICFKSVDASGNTSHKASDFIDFTAPDIRVDDGETLNTFVAIDTDHDTDSPTTWYYKFTNVSDACGSGVSFPTNSNYNEGDEIAYTDSRNGQRICFKSVDRLNNIGYRPSAPIDTDTTVPIITSISSTTDSGYYRSGSIINITVTLSESVTATNTLKLNLSNGHQSSACTTCSGQALVFSYTVADGGDGDYLDVTNFVTTGVTIVDAADNPANLVIPTNQNLADNKTIVIDTILPVITVTSNNLSASANQVDTNLDLFESQIVINQECDHTLTTGFSSYTAKRPLSLIPGQKACFRATDSAGNVTHAISTPGRDVVPPVIDITIGSTTHTFAATDNEEGTTWHYAFIDDGTTCGSGVTFPDENSYTEEDDVVYTDAHNGQKICFRSVDAFDNTNHKASPLIEDIDTTAPTITSITSTTDDGLYGLGSIINITVTLSESVTATNTLKLNLSNGHQSSVCSTCSGQALVFSYTVTTGGDSDDLDVTDFETTDVTIVDAATNPANLAIPATKNLADAKALVIDATPPDITVSVGTVNTNSYKASDGDAIGATIWHYAFIGKDVVCDHPFDFPDITSYTEGDEVGYTDSRNDQKLCFRSKDKSGNTSYAPSDVINTDTTPPTITSITSTTTDGSYGLGSIINITVTLSESVTATNTLKLNLSNGHQSSACTTCSGQALVFSYTVTTGGDSDDLDVTDFETTDVTIVDAATNPANLAIPATKNLADAKALVIDATPPVITVSVGTVNTNSYKATDNEEGTTWHYLFITGIDCDGDVTFPDTSDYTEGTEIAYTDSHNGQKLCFRSVDAADNASYGASPLIEDVDTTAPTITSITSTTDDGSYGLTSSPINITVTFSESVTATNTLKLNLSNGHQSSACTTCSGQALVFSYTVTTGGDSDDLDVTDFETTDVTIVDAATNPANLAIPATKNLADAKALVIDATPPTITSINSTTTDGSYGLDSIINITLNMSEVVTVTGDLKLNLSNGHQSSACTTCSGQALVFSYTVTTGGDSDDLDVTDFETTDVTIVDAATNPANLAIPATKNLADAKALVIDATPPDITVSVGTVNTNSYKATDNEEGTTWHRVYITPPAICDNTATFSEYTEGTEIAYTDSHNGQKLCFRSVDAADNASYGASPLIEDVDTTAPTITSITSTTDDGSYGLTSSPINITVTFSESVTATNTLKLNLSNGHQSSACTTCSGQALVFSYTVTTGGDSDDLDVTDFETTDVTIVDAATNPANLAIPATKNLADAKALVIDATPPTITSINSTTTDGSYGLDSIINITLNMSEVVTVTGDLKLNLSNGHQSSACTTCSGQALVFSYTVTTGGDSDDLDVTDFETTDVTIVDAATNPANLAIPATKNLADAKALVIDATPPDITVSVGTVNTNSYKATDNEEGTTWHRVYITPPAICDNTATFSEYTEGDEIAYTDSHNGQKLCFRSVDAADNASYGASPLIEDVDTTAPTITSISSTTDDGSYGLTSSPINITVTFSESVTATNTLKLNLSNGHQSSACTTCSGQALVFSYTVTTGGDSDDLDVTDFETTDVTIVDAATNPANLAIPATKNLADAKALVIDATPPVIAIDFNNLSVSAALTEANPSTFQSQIVTTEACNHTLTTGFSNYTDGDSLTLTVGQRACFKATDTASNTTYELSEAALKPPVITVSRGSVKNSFKAEDDEADGTTAWRLVLIDGNAACDNTVTFTYNSYTEGINFVYNDTSNTQKVCFRSTVKANTLLVSYKASAVIDTDTTAPTITVEAGTVNTNSYKATDNEEGTTWHYAFIGEEVACDHPFDFTDITSYTEDTEIAYTDSHNGQKLCFRSVDSSGNTSYAPSPPIEDVDTTAPVITSINSTTTDGLYGLGSIINITLNMSEVVTVTGDLKLNLSNGHQSSACTTCSGQALVFSYTVTTGGDSDDLDVTDFETTDVTIVDAATNPANLAIPATKNLADAKALVIDATPPVITVSVGTVNTNSYKATDNEEGTTWHYLFITGIDCDGDVTFPDTSDYTEGTEIAYTDSHNGQKLCFRSVDAADNASYGASPLIEDVDTTAPTITSITSTTDDGSYGLTSSPINITVTFSESVTATNTLKLNLSNGHQSSACTTCSGQALVFSYTVTTGGDSDDLDVTDFAPADVTIVDAANNPANLAIPATKNLADAKALVIDATPPEIRVDVGDATNSFKATDDDDGTTTWRYVFIASGTNCDKTLTFSDVYTEEGDDVVYTDAHNDQQICFRSQDTAENASYKASPPIEDVDTTAPVITSITSTTTDGSYGLGSIINITLNMSEVVTVTGDLKLNLSNGHQSSACTTCSGQALVFSYTVADGGDSDDLDVTDFETTGVTIVDAATNPANLAIPATKNLADAKAIRIDTIAPTITINFNNLSVSASQTDANSDLFESQIVTTQACTSALTTGFSDYTDDDPLTLTVGQRACFRATDSAGNVTHALSGVAQKLPIITVEEGSAPNTFKAEDDDDDSINWRYALIAGNATCNNTVTFTTTYTEGEDVDYTDRHNGQRICFRSEDGFSNAAYRASDIIRLKDTTPPTLTIEAGSAPNTFRATDDEPDNRTWRYNFWNPEFVLSCSHHVVFRHPYTEGEDVEYDSSHNRQKLCFRSEDRAGNFGYSSTSRLSAVPDTLVSVHDLPELAEREVCDPQFNLCYDATHFEPSGVWSDGTTMYVSDAFGRRVVAYDMTNDFTLLDWNLDEELDESGNYSPGALYSDGTHLYVTDSDKGRIYSYRISDKYYDKTKSITLRPNGSYFGRLSPYGIWSDGTKMWVSDALENHIYGVNIGTKRFSNGPFGPSNSAVEQAVTDQATPKGLWSDGTTLWVAVPGLNKVLAFDLATGDRTADDDIALNKANTDPQDLYSDGTHIWVVDRLARAIFKYEL